MKTYLNPGIYLPFPNTNATTIPSGSVVLLTNSSSNGHIGIAEDDIAAGAEGALRFSEVVSLPKKANDTFNIGDNVYWDNTNQYITSTYAGNVLAGLCVGGVSPGPSLAADATVRVHLNRR